MANRDTKQYEIISMLKAMFREQMNNQENGNDPGVNEGLRRAADIFTDCVGDFVPIAPVDKDEWVAGCIRRFDILIGSQYGLSDSNLNHDVGRRRGLNLAKEIFAQFAEVHLRECECVDFEEITTKRETLEIGLKSIFNSMLDIEKKTYPSSNYAYGVIEGLNLAGKYFMENVGKYVLSGADNNIGIWREGSIRVYAQDINRIKKKDILRHPIGHVNAVNEGLERSKAIFEQFAKLIWQ